MASLIPQSAIPALSKLFGSYATEGEISFAELARLSADFDLVPALVPLDTMKDLFTGCCTSARMLRFEGFCELLEQCGVEAFYSETENEDSHTKEESVSALLVYMELETSSQHVHGAVAAPAPHMEEPPIDAHLQDHDQSQDDAGAEEVGIWEIASQIFQSIMDLEDRAASKMALFRPAERLGRVLELEQLTANREAQTRAVVLGLEYERNMYLSKLQAVRKLASRMGEGSGIFGQIDNSDLLG